MNTLTGLGKKTIFIVTMGLLLCALPPYTYAQDSNGQRPEKKTVLLISSYHPGFPTFFQQIDGIKSEFENRNIALDIEFMDSKRFYTETNLDNFYRAIAYKLSKTEAYDAIIVTDDNALTFVLDHQSELFDNIPIVFCGVNNVDKALAQNENSHVTGVIEAVSMVETIELMIELNPDVANIIAIVDKTPSGQGDLATFYQSASQFAGVAFSEISLAELTWTEYMEALKRVAKDEAVLLLSAYRDKTGDTLTFDESLDLITENLGAPLYHLWYHGMGAGVLGGKLISHFEQGKTAAKIVLQILAGTPVEAIPVLNESPNRYLFDYAELKQFGIAKSALPPKSIIINEPRTFYARYKGLIWITATVVAVLLLLVILLSINVFKRRQAEEEIQRHHDQLENQVRQRTTELEIAKNKAQQYLDIAGVILVAIDADRRVTLINQKGCEVLEGTAGDIIGKDWFKTFIPVNMRSDVIQAFHRLMAGEIEPVEYFENPVLTQGGRERLIAWHNSLLKDDGGNIVGTLSSGEDITEQKRAEKQITSLNQNLLHRTAALEAANKELEAFAYSVSHDLRAPLRHIQGFLELLEKKAAAAQDEQSRHYMETISDSAKKMDLLIDDLLSFSRMGRQEMAFQQVDLRVLVRDIIHELGPDAAGRTIDWRIGDLPAVEGDASMLRIVLGNLIANAVKFTRPRQAAQIEIGSQPGQNSDTVIFVRDNGVGFDMTYADKLFGVFQRLHRADEFEGTGIGLANVRRIVARHGGRTWAEGQVNRGATFYVALPQN
ncbi:MAG: ATP-binding protein [Desulfobacteraceae bacterium]|jgi:PAS domain S-box-containing protein